MTALLITESRTFQGLSHKYQDKDKDQTHKDQDKDKDLTLKDQDKDKDLKLVLKETLRTRTRINITGFCVIYNPSHNGR